MAVSLIMDTLAKGITLFMNSDLPLHPGSYMYSYLVICEDILDISSS
jgi:hypothetical protein